VKVGQIEYERTHLLNKLKTRSPKNFKTLKNILKPSLHPIFKKSAGGIEKWEIEKI